MPRCPVTSVGEDFRPFTDRYQSDPWSFFARAREEEPVFFSPDMDAYVITRYDDVARVLKDPPTFSADNVIEFATPPCEAAMEKIMAVNFVPGPATVNEDDPEHRAHRDVLRLAFPQERIATIEPLLRRWVSEYVDAFAAVDTQTSWSITCSRYPRSSPSS